MTDKDQTQAEAQYTSRQLAVREELMVKYRCHYEKALTGRSIISAVRVHCLRCMASDTKAIQACDDDSCEFFKYRPYQKIPYRCRRRRTGRILDHYVTDENGTKHKKSPRPVQQDIQVRTPPSGPFTVRVTIVPGEQSGGT